MEDAGQMTQDNAVVSPIASSEDKDPALPDAELSAVPRSRHVVSVVPLHGVNYGSQDDVYCSSRCALEAGGREVATSAGVTSTHIQPA